MDKFDKELKQLDDEIKQLGDSLEKEGITSFWLRVNGEEALTPDQRDRLKRWEALRSRRLVVQVKQQAQNNPRIKIVRED